MADGRRVPRAVPGRTHPEHLPHSSKLAAWGEPAHLRYVDPNEVDQPVLDHGNDLVGVVPQFSHRQRCGAYLTDHPEIFLVLPVKTGLRGRTGGTSRPLSRTKRRRSPGMRSWTSCSISKSHPHCERTSSNSRRALLMYGFGSKMPGGCAYRFARRKFLVPGSYLAGSASGSTCGFGRFIQALRTVTSRIRACRPGRGCDGIPRPMKALTLSATSAGSLPLAWT